MCSACMTSSPSASKSAVEQSLALLDVGRVGGADQRRAHLLAGGAQAAGQHLQRDRVERAHPPAQPPPTIVPASSTRADQPGGTTKVASGSSKTTGPSASTPAARLAAQHRRRRPTRRRSGPGASSLGGRPPPAAAGPRPRPGRDHRQPDVDEDDLAVGVAMAVELLVGPLEALDQVGGVGRGRSRDRQLEGLAGVAHLVDDLGLGAGEARRRARGDQLATSAAIRSAVSSSPLEHHRAGGVAAPVRGAEAERREDAAGARAEDPLDARARPRSRRRASARRRRRAAARSGAGRRRARR